MKGTTVLLCIAMGILPVYCLGAELSPDCEPGQGYICFYPYEGSGGTFSFSITMANGEQCTVEMTVAGSTSAEDLAEQLGEAMDEECEDTAYARPCNEPWEHCNCIQQPPQEDDIPVTGISGTNPSGTVSGFFRGIKASPATARFDFIGPTTTGTAQVLVGVHIAVTGTSGKTTDQVKNELVTQLVAKGFNAVIDVDGTIRVDNVNSDDGTAILSMDPGFMSMSDLWLSGDEDEDGD